MSRYLIVDYPEDIREIPLLLFHCIISYWKWIHQHANRLHWIEIECNSHEKNVKFSISSSMWYDVKKRNPIFVVDPIDYVLFSGTDKPSVDCKRQMHIEFSMDLMRMWESHFECNYFPIACNMHKVFEQKMRNYYCNRINLSDHIDSLLIINDYNHQSYGEKKVQNKKSDWELLKRKRTQMSTMQYAHIFQKCSIFGNKFQNKFTIELYS